MGELTGSLGAISGQTRLAGVIGWPVRHSRSPAIHNAGFVAAELDWRFLALPVAPGRAPDAVRGMRALGIEGLSVTMPHKAAVIAALDALSSDATVLGAVNCIHRDGERLVGDNTDGGGFVDSLRLDEGIDVSGRRCLVLGAGGAARAVVRALAGAGADDVAVVARRADAAGDAAALAGTVGRVAAIEDLAQADLAVNATPVGMGDDVGLAFDPTVLPDHGVVVDLVYHPADTPLLAGARAAGRPAVGGLGMLVHQAARAFSSWTGVDAPLDAMRAAARPEPR